MSLEIQGNSRSDLRLHLSKSQLRSVGHTRKLPEPAVVHHQQPMGLSGIILECSDFVYSDAGFFLNEKACARPQICITVIKV